MQIFETMMHQNLADDLLCVGPAVDHNKTKKFCYLWALLWITKRTKTDNSKKVELCETYLTVMHQSLEDLLFVGFAVNYKET